MDDLTNLRSTLLSEASTFVTLFTTRLESSESDLETSAILDSFWEVLDGNKGEETDSRQFRMTSTLQDSALDLIPLLSPLLARPAIVKTPAEKLLLDGVGRHSSSREIMVAVGERLEALVEEADAIQRDQDEQSEDSDESEDDDQEESHDHSDPHHQHVPPPYTPPVALTSELPTLLALLALAIPRLTSKKSLPTIMNLESMLPPALTAVPLKDPTTTRIIVDRLAELVEVTRKWALGKDDWSEKGEQKSILLNILASSIVHLYPALAVGPGPAKWTEGVDRLMNATLPLLPLPAGTQNTTPDSTPRSLLTLLSSSHPQSTYAVLLLSAHITIHSPSPDLLTPPSPTHLLDLLTSDPSLLSRANAGGLPLVQTCLSAIRTTSPPHPPSTETVAAIFKTYLNPMATSPSPQQRKELFLLLKGSLFVPSVVPSPHTALDLILPLLSADAPLPTLRPVGLHFLQALVPTYGARWLGEEGALEKVQKVAFRLPFRNEGGEEDDVFVWGGDEEEDADGEDWIRGPGPVCVVLGLGVYQLLVSKDRANESGVRSPDHIERTKSVWLTPLRKRLDARRQARAELETVEEDGEEDESSGAWQAVEFALEGVERVLEGI